MKIIKQELQFEESLKQRLEFICEFAKVTPTFINGSIRKLDKKKIFERMDNQLKKLDNSYIMSFYGIYSNKLIMFLTARITEYSKEEQNKVAMYLANSV